MRQPTKSQIWDQVVRSILAKYIQGKSETEVFSTIEAHQLEGCLKQDCFLCRADAEIWCLMNHTAPRGNELLC